MKKSNNIVRDARPAEIKMFARRKWSVDSHRRIVFFFFLTFPPRIRVFRTPRCDKQSLFIERILITVGHREKRAKIKNTSVSVNFSRRSGFIDT